MTMTNEEIEKLAEAVEARRTAKEAADKLAAEKLAAEQADAFELGIHTYMKQAGITDEADQQTFLQTCAEVAAAIDAQA